MSIKIFQTLEQTQQLSFSSFLGSVIFLQFEIKMFSYLPSFNPFFRLKNIWSINKSSSARFTRYEMLFQDAQVLQLISRNNKFSILPWKYNSPAVILASSPEILLSKWVHFIVFSKTTWIALNTARLYEFQIIQHSTLSKEYSWNAAHTFF